MRAHELDSMRRSTVALRAGVSLASRAAPFVSRWAGELRDALHPPLCALCGRAGVGAAWCEEHALNREPAGPRCPTCAARLPEPLAEAGRCAQCRREPPRLARVVVLGDYRDRALREWILAFKHGGRPELATPLGAALAAHVVRCGAWDGAERSRLLCPVPLHRWRRLARGYDQARRLSEALAEELSANCAPLLRRTRATAVQGSSGALSRAANVRGAFEVRSQAPWWLRWRPSVARASARTAFVEFDELWLVDDVATSGATLRECARALRRCGARWVGALALARADGHSVNEARYPPSRSARGAELEHGRARGAGSVEA